MKWERIEDKDEVDASKIFHHTVIVRHIRLRFEVHSPS